MTIYRQIVLLIVGLLAAVFVGTMVTTVENSRAYLQEQLRSHAQDAATSLAISVSRFMASGELPAIISTTDAMFDSGYYRRITIVDMQDEVIVSRESNITLEGVPPWLIDLVPLDTPVSKAAIMNGWNQAGMVRVTSHPGYAYRQIWNNLIMNAAWFAVGALVLALIGVVILKITFRPLAEIERQAEAIARREFPLVENVPKTRELASIVRAMNKLTGAVKRILDEADASIAHLRSIAFQSPVTGLPNRQRFMSILGEKIESEEECSTALLCLIELCRFKEFNHRKGYLEGDRLLREAGRLLQASLPPEPKTVVAHLSGATFAVLTEDFQDATLLGNKLVPALCKLYELGITDTEDVAHVGISMYDGAQTTTQLLSNADAALRSAQSSGANQWAFHSGAQDESPARTASEWRRLIHAALDSDQLRLVFQPVVLTSDRKEFHREALVRLAEIGDDGTESLLNAGAFISMASSLGLAKLIDRHVIDRVVTTLETDNAMDETVAINLDAESIQDPEFVSWASEFLAKHANVANRICFELSEYGLVNIAGEFTRFVDRLSALGVRFGVDNVGVHNGVLSYLRSVTLDYIKIDGSFIRSLNQNRDHQFFVNTMVSVAHGLDVRVIAKSVEDEDVWNALQGLNVDGAQGFYIARPQAKSLD